MGGTFVPIQNSNISVPIVWDSVDCISYLFQQASRLSSNYFGKWITRFDLPRTNDYEGKLLCKFDHAIITSYADRKAMINLNSESDNCELITVVPNGVDLNYFNGDMDALRKLAGLPPATVSPNEPISTPVEKPVVTVNIQSKGDVEVRVKRD